MIIRNNVGYNTELAEKVVKQGFGIIVALGAIHCSYNGVAGEDSGADALENRLACDVGGSIQVSSADKRLNTVVEVEAGADESGC